MISRVPKMPLQGQAQWHAQSRAARAGMKMMPGMTVAGGGRHYRSERMPLLSADQS
jgi:hypothetical protein